MAERIEEPEAATEQALDQASPAAIALALGRTSKGGKALDAKAEAFLEKQTRLIDLQTEHLHEQRELQTSLLRLSRWKGRVTLGLQALTGLVGLALAGAVAAMAWQAHQDHGLTIAAFSVPPDLTGRGLTGQVVATRVLDRLSELQAETASARLASTYAENWGDDIKVEIPETGVSLGELNRYLRQWLGHETRITGEVVRTAAGVSVTARAGAEPGKVFQGADADFDKLVGQTAEALYAQTQPYRYAVWLSANGRRDEAYAAFARLAGSGAPEDRSWAYAGWASILTQEGRHSEAVRMAEAALRLNPRLTPALMVLGGSWKALSRDEAARAAVRREVALLASGRAVGLSRQATANRLHFMQCVEAWVTGDFGRAADLAATLEPIDWEGQAQGFSPDELHALSLASDHDVTASRRMTSQFKNPSAQSEYQQAAVLDGWTSQVANVEAGLGFSGRGEVRLTQLFPVAAIVYAQVGRFAEADALVAQTPRDCDNCLRARGLVAALQRDWPTADRWYAEAARHAPSLPFAHTEWGQALLMKGDPDAAIAKLEEAHLRSPHYADPLELWGEALMKKGDFAGAAAKFAEADKYAPRWGRNHLRWGQALMFAGRYRKARTQYEAANGLDLSRPDRAALTVFLDRTAKGSLHG